VAPGRAEVEPVLVVTRSAVGVRAVVTVAPGALPLLLAGLASGVAEVLLAVLLTLAPERGAMKLTVLATAGAPLAKLAIAGKVTIPVVELYVPPLDTTTPVKPGTMLSVTVTFTAELCPLLTVEIV
jgi:hypothetical protein